MGDFDQHLVWVAPKCGSKYFSMLFDMWLQKNKAICYVEIHKIHLMRFFSSSNIFQHINNVDWLTLTYSILEFEFQSVALHAHGLLQGSRHYTFDGCQMNYNQRNQNVFIFVMLGT